MSLPAPPDWRGLLSAVSDSTAAGRDLRADNDPANLFWITRDLRHSVRQLERGGAHEQSAHTQKLQFWQQIADNSFDILSSHSKDLDVAVWLIEAWTKLYGLHGVAAGLAFFSAFLRQFWAIALPQPEPDRQPADRVSAFAGLNGGNRPGTLVDALYAISITDSETGEPFAYWHFLNAQQADSHVDAEHRARRRTEMGFSMSDIHDAVQRGAADFYRTSHALAESAIEALDEINEFFQQQLAEQAPSTQLIKTHLVALRDIYTALRPALSEPDLSATPRGEDIGRPLRPFAAPVFGAEGESAIRSRDDAIARLQLVARYFHLTEPHSPLGCGIDKLIRWAHLPFGDLMRELITDSGSRTQFQLMTGVDLDNDN